MFPIVINRNLIAVKFNLFVNYYIDKNKERLDELNFCFLENLKNNTFQNIIIFCSDIDYRIVRSIIKKNNVEYKSKIVPILTRKRPSYNDYFMSMTKLFNSVDNVNIISNLDIIIPKQSLINDAIKLNILDYLPNNKCCLSLTRWDVKNKIEYERGAILFDRPDSQDTWIFRGGVPLISEAIFGLGICGCDNKISYLLEQNGYNVENPSRSIKTYHLHLTNIRNYTDEFGSPIESERIKPPYKLLKPTF